MTLIVGCYRSNAIIQVTDRLVTVGATPHDRQANKNVVYVTPDLQVVLGYTGLAYLDGIPTDEWMARHLWGREFGEMPGIPVLQGNGSPVEIFDGKALSEMLVKWVIEAYSRLTRQSDRRLPLTIAISGWARRAEDHAPLYAIVQMQPGEAQPRMVTGYLEQPIVYAQPVGNLSQSELNELTAALDGAETLRDDERLLVERVRVVARRNPLVGSDCVAIFLDAPHKKHVCIRYHGHRGFMATNIRSAPRYVSAWYGPWVVTSTGYRVAAKYGGRRDEGIPMLGGGCEIHFGVADDGASSGPIIAVAQPARRRRPP